MVDGRLDVPDRFRGVAKGGGDLVVGHAVHPCHDEDLQLEVLEELAGLANVALELLEPFLDGFEVVALDLQDFGQAAYLLQYGRLGFVSFDAGGGVV